VLPASFPVDLTWNAPVDCPTRDEVTVEITRLLSASAESRVEVTARADVSHDQENRWHARLSVRTRDAHSERTLDAESCPAIASATAVIVALAVEGGMPDRVSPSASQASKPEPASPSAAQPRGSQVVIGAAGVFDAGSLPLFAPGVEGSLGWATSWSRWRVRAVATGSFFPSQDSAPLPDRSGAPGEFGRFELFAAAARVCGSIVLGAVDVGPCLGAEADVMTGTRVRAALPTRNTGAWALAVGSALVSWSLTSHWAFVLRGEGFYAPSTPWFGLTSGANHIDVYRPSSTGARGALGLEVRFF
jgi:hypothetical protein